MDTCVMTLLSLKKDLKSLRVECYLNHIQKKIFKK